MNRLTLILLCLIGTWAHRGEAQLKYRILIEGRYASIMDSALYASLDWYGFYERDSIGGTDWVQPVSVKIRLRVNVVDSTRTFFESTISTSLPKKSMFLLGTKKGEPFDFKSRQRCYGFQKHRDDLAPGNRVGIQLPTMSCAAQSFVASGNVRRSDGKMRTSRYRVFAERASYVEEEMKTQEITSEIVENKRAVYMGAFPSLYATGDFDLDGFGDFIICNIGVYHLYLSKDASPGKIAKRVAKDNLLYRLIDLPLDPCQY